MCGLFGYIGGGRPDMERLAMAAGLAAKRGPDGWGIVTDQTQERGLGRLPQTLARGIVAERFVIGHCRLATVLGTKTPAACQPLQVGRFVVAHNGTVANVEQLRQRFGFGLATGNDSEAIAHVLDRIEGPTEARLSAALEAIDHGGHYALVVLDLQDMTVHLKAQAMPLWVYRAGQGAYWCSIRPGQEWGAIGG
jgi:glucosamine 6-phosphate synthetase-like amidotransferase/phosphosugar isomerase protein